MNKFIIIGIVLIAIVVGGIIWKSVNTSSNGPVETGAVKEITIVSKKLQWTFEPEEITVEQGDRLKLTVLNEDDFDHGFAIDAFGISQRLPANGQIYVEFVATKSGTFPFYCSVSCSDSKATGNLLGGVVAEGRHAGEFRGHFEHLGKIVVTALQRAVGGTQ